MMGQRRCAVQGVREDLISLGRAQRGFVFVGNRHVVHITVSVNV